MKISIETLYHFQCSSCRKWWSIGDAEPNKDKWWCPWCGHEHINVKEAEENKTNRDD